MRKEKLILSFITFIILINLNLLVFAAISNVDIIAPEIVNFGEKISVSLKVPENTYGIEATVILKYSDGTEETQKLVYVNGFGGTQNLVTFDAKVGGTAQITVTDIILCDANANTIETEKTKVTTINIKRDITKIKIENPIVDSSVENSSYTWELGKYEYLCFNLHAYPIDATQIGEIKWSSSNENIIKIEKNTSENSSSPSYDIPGYGKSKCIDSVKIRTLNPGKATITAKCGNLTDTYEINVISPIKNFSLNKNSINLYYNKDTNKKSLGNLQPVIEPINTTDSKIVSWSTLDSAIATVENGIVTPTGIGKTVIIAKCGNFTASCEVVVSNEIINTTLEEKDVTINSEKKTAIFSDSNKLVKDLLIEENFPIIISNAIKIFDENGNEKSLTDKVGSKNILKIMDSQNNILSEYIIIVLGDVTGDGEVKMHDAFQILKETLFSGNNLNEIDILIRDFNGDGIVKMYDAFSFLKYSLFN